MAEHASDLRLDELAAGLPVPEEVRAHVPGCAACSGRLRQIEAARSQARESVGYARVRARVRAAPPPPRPWWRWLALGAPAVAAAAALLLVVVGPGPGTGTRVKGAFSIAVVGEDGQELQRARPGDRVGIAVGAAGRAQVLVLAMDDHGAVEVLWPVEGKESGAAPPGARAVLGTSFDVTPGSLALYALFGNAPISAAEAQAALKSEVTTAAREGRGPLEAQAPRGPWEGAAKIVVQVAP